MAQIVIDASLAAAWCFPDEHTDYTNKVLRIVGETMDPIAPALWAYEVRNTLLMGLKRGRITKEGAQNLLVFLNDLNVQLLDPPSHDAVFSLAETHGLTVYDASYLDLAHLWRALTSLCGRLRSMPALNSSRLREGAKLVIEQRGDDELVLRRDGSDWRLLQGIAAGEDLLAARKVEKDSELARE